MNIICIIASQGKGSNYRSDKDNFRPIYLRETISSLLDSTVLLDLICISYNDMSQEGENAYDNTKAAFSNQDTIVFLRQDKPCSQFEHITHAINHCISRDYVNESTHILFMDDDDWLGSGVIKAWSSWYKSNSQKCIVSYQELYNKLNDVLSDIKHDNIWLSNNDMQYIQDMHNNPGDCIPYIWFTGRLIFGHPFDRKPFNIKDLKNTEISINDHPDFPGTIMPLSLAVILINRMKDLTNAGNDMIFRIIGKALIKKFSELQVITHNSRIKNERLYYRL